MPRLFRHRRVSIKRGRYLPRLTRLTTTRTERAATAAAAAAAAIVQHAAHQDADVRAHLRACREAAVRAALPHDPAVLKPDASPRAVLTLRDRRAADRGKTTPVVMLAQPVGQRQYARFTRDNAALQHAAHAVVRRVRAEQSAHVALTALQARSGGLRTADASLRGLPRSAEDAAAFLRAELARVARLRETIAAGVAAVAAPVLTTRPGKRERQALASAGLTVDKFGAVHASGMPAPSSEPDKREAP